MKKTVFLLMAVVFAMSIILSGAKEARAMSSDTAAAMITVGAILFAIPLIDAAVSDRRDYQYNQHVIVHKPYKRTYYNKYDYYSSPNRGCRNEWREDYRAGYRDNYYNPDSDNHYRRSWR
jgi:hypothetical protein